MQRRHVKKGEPPWHPDEVNRMLVDSFETPLRRPSIDERQRQVYSGKRKRHTIARPRWPQIKRERFSASMQAIVDQRKTSGFIEESGVHQQFPNADKLGDKGYQSQAHSEIISPHKKPKWGELTPEQRHNASMWNTASVASRGGESFEKIIAWGSVYFR